MKVSRKNAYISNSTIRGKNIEVFQIASVPIFDPSMTLNDLEMTLNDLLSYLIISGMKNYSEMVKLSMVL